MFGLRSAGYVRRHLICWKTNDADVGGGVSGRISSVMTKKAGQRRARAAARARAVWVRRRRASEAQRGAVRGPAASGCLRVFGLLRRLRHPRTRAHRRLPPPSRPPTPAPYFPRNSVSRGSQPHSSSASSSPVPGCLFLFFKQSCQSLFSIASHSKV